MSRWTIVLPALPALALIAATHPAPPAQPANTGPFDGKALFQEKCAMCHGTGGMGTALLARRVKPALLAERTDLTKAYVVQAARMGLGNMPAITRGEVSDKQLDAIAAWLAAGPGGRK